MKWLDPAARRERTAQSILISGWRAGTVAGVAFAVGVMGWLVDGGMRYLARASIVVVIRGVIQVGVGLAAREGTVIAEPR